MATKRPLRSKPLFKVGDTILCSMEPELGCDGTHPQIVTEVFEGTFWSGSHRRERKYRHGGMWGGEDYSPYCPQSQAEVRRYWRLVEGGLSDVDLL